MAVQHIDQVRNAADGTLGVGAVTSPFWSQLLQDPFRSFMLIGGALLLAGRLILLALDLWARWKARGEQQ